MPAILKGYFDRVWAQGVAFHLPEGGGAIIPGLANIRRVWVVTTYGAPWWLIRLVLRDPVVAVALSGTRRPREIEENVKALDVVLSPATLERIERCMLHVAGQTETLPVP